MGKKIRYKDAAEQLGVPVGTVYALVSSGKIPHLRYGPRLVVFDEEELLGWMEERGVVAKEAKKDARA